jgi:D-alanyl-lipoteichoic acid acyltransferase DltB (MBOAT superfamily)
MVFASYNFLLIFLPIALVGYYLATKLGAECAVAWLVLASLAFYAVWNPAFVILLLCSIAFNFLIGRAMLAREREKDSKSRNRLLFVGVAANLLLLFSFKYLGPILSWGHAVSLVSPRLNFNVVLPLGISFFTFTQIGYLVDCNHGRGRDLDLIRYAAFVTLFPHLIAGPILHVREIGPQLLNPDTYRLRLRNLSVGTSYFIIGLAKKVLLADPLADVVRIGFAHPGDFAMFRSWLYALAYSLQLYFDFSGYSDMAIGLAYMFGIKFPINFNSPYKSRNIIEFWKRWHITLTRYLTSLLYTPIALYFNHRRLRNTRAKSNLNAKTFSAFGSLVLAPILITFALAGIWHGAGLQFLLFGLMHGVYLTINHAWQWFGPKASEKNRGRLMEAGIVAWKVLLTYVAVIATQVMFRATSVGAALQMMGGMIGLHGVDPIPVPGTLMAVLRHLGPIHPFLTKTHQILAVPVDDSIPSPARLAVLFFIVWALPNSQMIMAKFSPTLAEAQPDTPRWLLWQPTARWALALGLLLAVCLMSLQQTKVFLYFQF